MSLLGAVGAAFGGFAFVLRRVRLRRVCVGVVAFRWRLRLRSFLVGVCVCVRFSLRLRCVCVGVVGVRSRAVRVVFALRLRCACGPWSWLVLVSVRGGLSWVVSLCLGSVLLVVPCRLRAGFSVASASAFLLPGVVGCYTRTAGDGQGSSFHAF